MQENYFTNKNILITGVTGFIGSNLAERLRVLGAIVFGVSRFSQSKYIFKADMSDFSSIDQIIKSNNIDVCYHLAAYAAEGLSHFIRKFNYENNLIGSINLINRSVRNNIKHFIFASSIAVYGTNQNPMTENLMPLPEDPYGVAKYATELDLKATHKMFGLQYTIFRLHNVYGEKQNYGDPYRNVLGIFINNLLQGKPMPIFGDGKQRRAFSYIDDVTPHIARCIEYPKARNEIFNMGADKPYTVLELAYEIARALRKDPKIEFLAPRKEVVEAYCDHAKAKKVFNITKTVELNEGIKRMIDWAIFLGSVNPKKFKNIEIRKNIPLGWKKLI